MVNNLTPNGGIQTGGQLNVIFIELFYKTRSRACVGNSLCIESDGGDGNKKKSFCDPATCAYWSDWKSSSSCRPTCGQSNPVHHRDCLGYYLVEQKCPLDGDRLQNETCSLGECPYWGSWLNWSPCSTSCGRGVRSRERTCLGDFPKKLCQELGNAKSSEVSDDVWNQTDFELK